MTGQGPLGIIAGAGVLPVAVAEAAAAGGREVYVVALEGFADAALERFDHDWSPISRGGHIIAMLRRRGCRELVLVGAVRRPTAWLRHAGSLIWFALRNPDVLAAGDSTVLARVVKVLERHGFVVRGAHEVVPALVIPAGPLGRRVPDAAELDNIETGFRIALELGRLDVGQGAVVARGRVLAVEAAEGTDRMLDRVGALNPTAGGRRAGVLVKCPQPIQDLRVDMPTIGPETVRRAAAAGLAGIAIVAGRVLVSDAQATAALADALGLFVVARQAGAAAEPRAQAGAPSSSAAGG
jgi:hypothetical protein